MIAQDQPRIAPDITIAISSKEDGTVLDRSGVIDRLAILLNRKNICLAAGLDYDNCVNQCILYHPDASYESIAEVDSRSVSIHTQEIVADVLFTRSEGVGLFLPVADCVATVLYDPIKRYLALAHLGRHSTVSQALSRTIRHFVANGSNPSDILVYMSPSAQRNSYRLDYFDHSDEPQWRPFVDEKDDGVYIDMQHFNERVCLDNGILADHITISDVDTVTNENYFSHSAGDTSGRFAVIAMMNPRP